MTNKLVSQSHVNVFKTNVKNDFQSDAHRFSTCAETATDFKAAERESKKRLK